VQRCGAEMWCRAGGRRPRRRPGNGDEGDDNLHDRHGSDYVYGNGGKYYINTKDGKRDHVDCGSGGDSFATDRIDVVRNCEVPAT
jgi:hypothetical protein